MSTGELHVNGLHATYELRIPTYEIAHVTNPETALLEQVKFEGARRTSSTCQEQDGTYVCRANYEFPAAVPDKIEVQCTLFQVTVPNHVHLLYAVQGPNSDQEVFDQSFRQATVRFHPPSRAERIAKAAAAGIARLFKSVSGLLFLLVLMLAARNTREMGILTLAFLAGEWLVRPLSPRKSRSYRKAEPAGLWCRYLESHTACPSRPSRRPILPPLRSLKRFFSRCNGWWLAKCRLSGGVPPRE
jgi:hypothetical protein